jgi:hypothetical protein
MPEDNRTEDNAVEGDRTEDDGTEDIKILRGLFHGKISDSDK